MLWAARPGWRMCSPGIGRGEGYARRGGGEEVIEISIARIILFCVTTMLLGIGLGVQVATSMFLHYSNKSPRGARNKRKDKASK